MYWDRVNGSQGKEIREYGSTQLCSMLRSLLKNRDKAKKGKEHHYSYENNFNQKVDAIRGIIGPDKFDSIYEEYLTNQ